MHRIAAATALLIAASLAPAKAEASRPPLVLVSGGCGFAFHRNFYGACVPNGGFYGGFGPVVRRLPPPCPRFYHRDPDPARPICYPNL